VKRRRDDEGTEPLTLIQKNVKIDKETIKQLTLKKIMNASAVMRNAVSAKASFAESEVRQEDWILCEGCHKRAPRARSTDSLSLVGECRFCSRRNLCDDCWSVCKQCGMEACPLCSVKDYSGRDTAAICLDCKRHASRLCGIIRR
jgi:hypothetical protein